MNMFKHTLLTASLGMALSFGAGQANAMSLDLGGYTGIVQIKYNLYTTECTTTTGNPNGCYGGNVSNPGQTVSGLPGPGGGTYNETTWGVGVITTIQDNNGNALYNAPLVNANTGNQIMFLVYGIADARTLASPTDPNIYNVGCQGGAAGTCDGNIHFDAYEVAQSAYKAKGGLAGYATSLRTGFDTFTGVTTPANLVFKMTFTPGIDTSGATIGTPGFPAANAELIQAVSGSTLPASGRGAWLANCTSGPACSGGNGINFDSNGQPLGADFFGQFTLQNVTSPLALANGWLGFTNDPVNTATIPEPNVMFLFASGLLGMAGARRIVKRRG